MIDGVQIIPLRKIPDDRGCVMHMLKKTDPHFSKFGEIYFTTLYPGIVKAWHIHQKMDLNYACLQGTVKVVLFDSRPRSSTKDKLEEYYIGEHYYSLLQIPHGVTNGMKCVSPQTAIVANCATLIHDPAEILRFSPTEVSFEYDWSLKTR